MQLLATLTILFSVWEKRDTVTAAEVVQVKADMDLCMDIMGDVGSLLGRFPVRHVFNNDGLLIDYRRCTK